MKILFQSRVDIFDRRGGDTVQMEETKASLEKLGVNVDITTDLTPDVSNYDLVHVFNIDWVCEPYIQVKNAKKQGKPVILSPIHHSIKEFERYENESRYGLMRLGNLLLPSQPLRDAARNLVKGVLYRKKLKPAIIQLLMGIRKQQKIALEMSDHVLVQTNKEASDLISSYNLTSLKWTKVINGVNAKKFLVKNTNQNRKENYIISTGRIEPRKNQITLIKALSELRNNNSNFENTKVYFAGAKNNHHPTYLKEFNKALAKNPFAIHLGFMDQKKLAKVLNMAKVFAAPSWFETTGLVYLEAVVAGVPCIVASGERAKEYLEDNAVYCDPGNVKSVAKALDKGFKSASVKKGFREFVIKTYTWENAAKQTLEVYKSVLNKHKV